MCVPAGSCDPSGEELENDYDYCNEHDWSEAVETSKDLWQRTCKSCKTIEEEFLVVKYWEDKFITILGVKYQALMSWGNISLCSHCKKVIMGIPLILWDTANESKAVTFHFNCAKELGILDRITKGMRGG